MRNALLTVAAVCLVSLNGLNTVVDAAQGMNERQVKNLVKRIEKNADRFRQSLDKGLDRSQLDGSRVEDNINQFVEAFEKATNRLKERVGDREATPGDAEAVLERAVFIDNFMRRNSRRLNARATNDWLYLRSDLDRLAQLYSIVARWQTGSS